MATGGNYYALTLSATGTTASAFYGITPTSDLTISQGGATIVPTQPATTLVNIYPQELQIQAPPGIVNAGVTIVTDAGTIAGHAGVSPPVTVAVVITLYGAGGAQIGQTIIDPGSTGKAFEFPVDGAEAMSMDGAIDVLKSKIAESRS